MTLVQVAAAGCATHTRVPASSSKWLRGRATVVVVITECSQAVGEGGGVGTDLELKTHRAVEPRTKVPTLVSAPRNLEVRLLAWGQSERSDLESIRNRARFWLHAGNHIEPKE